MQFHYFIGIDVSKNTLDWAIYTSSGLVGQFQSDNSPKAISRVVKQLLALPQFTLPTSICCLEHIGIYNAHVLEVLYQEGFPLWLEASIQIKQAGGLQRGKSDAIDAVRIAEYAYRFRDRLRIWQPTRSVLKQLTELSQLRHRLQSSINQLAVPLTEKKRFGDPALQCQLKNHCGDSLKALRKDLEQVEASLKSLIQHDTELKTLFSLLTSIPGVGTIVATEIVIPLTSLRLLLSLRN